MYIWSPPFPVCIYAVIHSWFPWPPTSTTTWFIHLPPPPVLLLPPSIHVLSSSPLDVAGARVAAGRRRRPCASSAHFKLQYLPRLIPNSDHYIVCPAPTKKICSPHALVFITTGLVLRMMIAMMIVVTIGCIMIWNISVLLELLPGKPRSASWLPPPPSFPSTPIPRLLPILSPSPSLLPVLARYSLTRNRAPPPRPLYHLLASSNFFFFFYFTILSKPVSLHHSLFLLIDCFMKLLKVKVNSLP